MIRALACTALFLSSCASWRELEQRAWKRDGACGIVCDYRRGYMSAALAVDRFQCMCSTPDIVMFNQQHIFPLANSLGFVRCALDCETEAAEIVRRQPWRGPR